MKISSGNTMYKAQWTLHVMTDWSKQNCNNDAQPKWFACAIVGFATFSKSYFMSCWNEVNMIRNSVQGSHFEWWIPVDRNNIFHYDVHMLRSDFFIVRDNKNIIYYTKNFLESESTYLFVFMKSDTILCTAMFNIDEQRERESRQEETKDTNLNMVLKEHQHGEWKKKELQVKR